MDIGLFDNFEDDGQLSLFGMGEGVEDLRETNPGEVREKPAEVRRTDPAEEGGKAAEARGTNLTEGREKDVAEARETNPAEAGEQLPSSGSAGIRIRQCSCCGKLLFVKEEEDCYLAACNACGVSYVQKK